MEDQLHLRKSIFDEQVQIHPKNSSPTSITYLENLLTILYSDGSVLVTRYDENHQKMHTNPTPLRILNQNAKYISMFSVEHKTNDNNLTKSIPFIYLVLLRDNPEGDLISIYKWNASATRPYFPNVPEDLKDEKEIALNKVEVLNIQLKESFYKIVPQVCREFKEGQSPHTTQAILPIFLTLLNTQRNRITIQILNLELESTRFANSRSSTFVETLQNFVADQSSICQITS